MKPYEGCAADRMEDGVHEWRTRHRQPPLTLPLDLAGGALTFCLFLIRLNNDYFSIYNYRV